MKEDILASVVGSEPGGGQRISSGDENLQRLMDLEYSRCSGREYSPVPA